MQLRGLVVIKHICSLFNTYLHGTGEWLWIMGGDGVGWNWELNGLEMGMEWDGT